VHRRLRRAGSRRDRRRARGLSRVPRGGGWFYAVETAGAGRPVIFFPHVIARWALPRAARRRPRGGALAYLIAPPLESIVGLDAACKAARTTLASGSGRLPRRTSAAVPRGRPGRLRGRGARFADAIVDVCRAPRGHGAANGRRDRDAGSDAGASIRTASTARSRRGSASSQARPPDASLDDSSLVRKTHRASSRAASSISCSQPCSTRRRRPTPRGASTLVGELGEISSSRGRSWRRGDRQARAARAPLRDGRRRAARRDHHTRELYGVPFHVPRRPPGARRGKLGLARAVAREAEVALTARSPPRRRRHGAPRARRSRARAQRISSRSISSRASTSRAATRARGARSVPCADGVSRAVRRRRREVMTSGRRRSAHPAAGTPARRARRRRRAVEKLERLARVLRRRGGAGLRAAFHGDAPRRARSRGRPRARRGGLRDGRAHARALAPIDGVALVGSTRRPFVMRARAKLEAAAPDEQLRVGPAAPLSLPDAPRPTSPSRTSRGGFAIRRSRARARRVLAPAAAVLTAPLRGLAEFLDIYRDVLLENGTPASVAALAEHVRFTRTDRPSVVLERAGLRRRARRRALGDPLKAPRVLLRAARRAGPLCAGSASPAAARTWRTSSSSRRRHRRLLPRRGLPFTIVGACAGAQAALDSRRRANSFDVLARALSRRERRDRP